MAETKAVPGGTFVRLERIIKKEGGSLLMMMLNPWSVLSKVNTDKITFSSVLRPALSQAALLVAAYTALSLVFAFHTSFKMVLVAPFAAAIMFLVAATQLLVLTTCMLFYTGILDLAEWAMRKAVRDQKIKPQTPFMKAPYVLMLMAAPGAFAWYLILYLTSLAMLAFGASDTLKVARMEEWAQFIFFAYGIATFAPFRRSGLKAFLLMGLALAAFFTANNL